MTDERAGDPVRGSRPATPGSDATRAGTRTTGPASAPFRLPVATPTHGARRPTMVPMTRRRGPRLGLRPPGAALTTAPTTIAPAVSSPGTPSSGIPSPAAQPPPSTRGPVDAVTLPAGRVPAPVLTPPTETPAVDAAREPDDGAPAVPAPPPPRGVVTLAPAARPVVPPSEEVAAAERERAAAPVESPAVRHVRAASVAAAPTPAVAAASASATTTARATATGARRPAETAARESEAHWAATSALLAWAGARMAVWRGRWTWLRVARLLTATCALLVVIVCGLGWGAASWVEAAVRQIGALDPDSPAIRDAAAQVGDQNFLVVGSDTRAGAPPSEDAGDAADVPGARTDTIMIVHVPDDRSAVTVVSFPRDLEITRPACERWDPVSGAYSPEVLPPTPRVKLNSAYAAGGPRCVTRTIQEISGLAVNRFLGVDFQGFQGMVDAVHGVPICVERPVDDSVLGPIIAQAGPTVLTGQQALDYVRARHVDGDPSSDYGRIQRQQRFLGALLRSVLSAGTLLDPSRLQGLVEAVARSTFGENIGSDQLLTLAQSLGSVDPRAVTFVTVPTTGIANDRGNEVLRPGEERALFSAIIGEQPLPGTPGAVPAPVPGAPPAANVRLVDARSPGASQDDGDHDDGDDHDGEHHDGGDHDGDDREGLRAPAELAGPSTATVAERLRADGFRVVTDDSGSPSTGVSGTTIRYSPDQAAAAQALSSAVPGATLDPGASGRGTLTLVLGDDFDGQVRSAAAPEGATPSTPVNPTITAADASCT